MRVIELKVHITPYGVSPDDLNSFISTATLTGGVLDAVAEVAIKRYLKLPKTFEGQRSPAEKGARKVTGSLIPSLKDGFASMAQDSAARSMIFGGATIYSEVVYQERKTWLFGFRTWGGSKSNIALVPNRPAGNWWAYQNAAAAWAGYPQWADDYVNVAAAQVDSILNK